MKRRRIEVSAIRPDECMHLGINAYLIEEHFIHQRSEQLALKYWSKVDNLGRFIIESDLNPMGTDNLKRNDSVNWMTHAILTYRCPRTGGFLGVRFEKWVRLATMDGFDPNNDIQVAMGSRLLQCTLFSAESKHHSPLTSRAGADVLPLRFRNAQTERGRSHAAVNPSSSWRPP